MFRLVKINDGRINQPEPELHTVTTSETVTIGEALVLTSGALTKCAATAAPEFIAAKAVTSAAAGTKIPVWRITPQQLWEAPITGTTALIVGGKYTLTSNADGITTTSTSGVATVADKLNAASTGDKVLVRFI